MLLRRASHFSQLVVTSTPDENGAQPVATANGSAEPWLISNVRRKKILRQYHMKESSPIREFYIAAVLVTAQTIFGFWRYNPKTPVWFAIAILASVAIAIGIWTKKRWVRGAAMIIAALTILGDLADYSTAAVQWLLVVRIVLSAAVLYWLSRAGVKAHFPEEKRDAA